MITLFRSACFIILECSNVKPPMDAAASEASVDSTQHLQHCQQLVPQNPEKPAPDEGPVQPPVQPSTTQAVMLNPTETSLQSSLQPQVTGTVAAHQSTTSSTSNHLKYYVLFACNASMYSCIKCG